MLLRIFSEPVDTVFPAVVAGHWAVSPCSCEIFLILPFSVIWLHVMQLVSKVSYNTYQFSFICGKRTWCVSSLHSKLLKFQRHKTLKKVNLFFVFDLRSICTFSSYSALFDLAFLWKYVTASKSFIEKNKILWKKLPPRMLSRVLNISQIYELSLPLSQNVIK